MSQGWATPPAPRPPALAAAAPALSAVTRALAAAALVLAAASLVAPAGAGSPPRFDVEAPPVTSVDDGRPIPPPAARGWNEIRAFIDDHWLWPVTDLLGARGRPPAQDVNALDEVPVSAWYAGPSAGDAAAGTTATGLELRAPLTVDAARTRGDEPCLWVRDSGGRAFLLILDDPRRPERQTAAALIAGRLLRAAGYHTPPGGIGAVSRADLVLGEDPVAIGEFGGGRRLDAAALDRLFAGSPRRVAAFSLPAGTRLGGFRERGTRPDDPNDRIPHEHRRSLRGLAPLCAWLDHRRVDEAHTLDLYLDEGRHVRHYLTQLGHALGAGDPVLPSGAARGLSGAFQAQGFDPPAWRTRQPYAPFEALEWADLFWGLRVLLAIPETEIRAAVAAARYADAGIEGEMVGLLLERRERIGRAWLGRMNGAFAFRLEERAPGRWQLACADLAASHGLRSPEDVSFAMTLRLPETGRVLGLQTRGGGVPAFDLAPFMPPVWAHRLDPRRYAVAEIRSWDHAGRALEGRACVHLYFDREAGPRIVGIVRD